MAESLDGKNLCFAGTLSTQTRAEATKVAKELGAKVTTVISGKTDILVAGDGAAAKIKQAKSKGIEVWTEEDFNSFVAGDKENENILYAFLFKKVNQSTLTGGGVRRHDF